MVYLSDDAAAVKLYTVRASQERISKLNALVALKNDALQRVAAWPTALAYDTRGSVAGFLMPYIKERVPLTKLTSPADRKRIAPDRHWDFLAHVSRNIAAGMQTIHDCGVVIGDVNDLNIFVSVESGRVTFLDVDSFQVRCNGTTYPTGVGVPMYLAPELQGRSLEGLVRSVEHDRFALAVLIFQALMMGRHPFVGTGNIGVRELPDMIRDLPFAYGATARAHGIVIPKLALPLSVLSAELGTLFTRAFESTVRPEAREWVQPLERFQRMLKACPSNAGHLYVPDRSPCPWCELDKLSVVMFYASSKEIASSFGASDAGASAYRVWFDSIQLPSANPPLDPEILSLPATEAPANTASYYVSWSLGWLVMLVAVAAMWMSVWFWPATLTALVGVMLLVGNRPSKRRERVRAERAALVRDAELQWKKELQAWQRPPIAITVEEKRREMRRAIDLVGNRQREWETRLAALESGKRQIQLDEYLDGQDISSAGIRSLTRPVITMLASFGISTALDVTRLSQTKVPGVGEVRAGALREWRRDLERRFVYDDRKPLPQALVRVEEAKLAKEIAAAERALPTLRMSIDAGLSVWTAEREAKMPRLRLAAEQLSRARANLASA